MTIPSTSSFLLESETLSVYLVYGLLDCSLLGGLRHEALYSLTHSSFLNKKLLLQTVYLYFPSEPALPTSEHERNLSSSFGDT